MEDYVYIKKEEDNVSIKSEDKGTNKRAKRVSLPQGNIDIPRNTARINEGLSTIVSQYVQTMQFDDVNQTNTLEVDQALREMENYVYRMHKEGEMTMQIFAYCNNVIVATRKWNETITQQQEHMKEYVLNSINYNRELHSLYLEVSKKQQYFHGRQKRDPASPFNTVPTEIEFMTLNNNDNDAISSIF